MSLIWFLIVLCLFGVCMCLVYVCVVRAHGILLSEHDRVCECFSMCVYVMCVSAPVHVCSPTIPHRGVPPIPFANVPRCHPVTAASARLTG